MFNIRGKVYRGSSDEFLVQHKKYLQQFVPKPNNLYAIIGGMSFLNLITYINPKRVHLFDYNPFEGLKMISFINFIQSVPLEDITASYFYDNWLNKKPVFTFGYKNAVRPDFEFWDHNREHYYPVLWGDSPDLTPDWLKSYEAFTSVKNSLAKISIETKSLEEVQEVPAKSYIYATNLVGRSQCIDDNCFSRRNVEEITDE